MSTKEIALGKGYVALIDSADWELVSPFHWYVAVGETHRPRAQATVRVHGGLTSVQMHRFILGVTAPRIWVVQRNNVYLDNRRSNLVAISASKSMHTRSLRVDNTSGFRGVTFSRHLNKWCAQIALGGIKKNLGFFSTPEEASAVCRAASLELYGNEEGQ